MSADRGQTNVVVVKAVCVFILAALAAFVFVRLQTPQPPVAEVVVRNEVPLASDAAPAAAADTSATAEPAAAPATETTQALPRLLDLGSTTCVPCKLMAPILDEMKETFAGELTVEFIDVRTDKDAAKQYGIQVIPTQIFFDASGSEVFRHQGFFSREDILAKWKELGVRLDG
jgi:thiol-disulfide isomerase/thioredoxin